MQLSYAFCLMRTLRALRIWRLGLAFLPGGLSKLYVQGILYG
jgi:hypothetical protein